jgi:hypothetical protein
LVLEQSLDVRVSTELESEGEGYDRVSPCNRRRTLGSRYCRVGPVLPFEVAVGTTQTVPQIQKRLVIAEALPSSPAVPYFRVGSIAIDLKSTNWVRSAYAKAIYGQICELCPMALSRSQLQEFYASPVTYFD